VAVSGIIQGVPRITTWINASLLAVAATIAVDGFVEAARMNDAPTLAECVDDWNSRAGEDEQAMVAAESYRSATVNGWYHDGPGCGITFTVSEDEPFLTCTRAFDPSDSAGTDWSCEWGGTLSGAGHPAGTPGVAVRADWQLALSSEGDRGATPTRARIAP
jgi:hypothetical protein